MSAPNEPPIAYPPQPTPCGGAPRYHYSDLQNAFFTGLLTGIAICCICAVLIRIL